MDITNQDILVTAQAQALQQLMSSPMKGKHSLMLKRLAPVFDEELERIMETRQEIAQKSPAQPENYDAMSAEEKKEYQESVQPVREEMDEMLQDTVELPMLKSKLPEEVVYEADISSYQLETLDWLIDFETGV